mmetsp:Transcript_90254/g.160763  ORF Transcript_90254/g.160763 Transcript_90254/m.160763 type:complete len:209 (+) Transcript_90254:75-701(+)|eukprot:CAMPEP_0197651292 /NCGR_PEP_ID=MMETSP1338-20131121/31825_1 /TAXON_ID=43686 ORGANISM="Pelagodinium beii, Strain RCC1491" /NCGR_SAMPLE_ID=MMETSP1338 /ASSEMBLY_ACC=CAM_ASM_000754 /LENGTH=208 /DNA_ID=CAMNT_0043225889 /DNA_START=72 /DNA_END=698 /DNA_ORIENTATION=-
MNALLFLSFSFGAIASSKVTPAPQQCKSYAFGLEEKTACSPGQTGAHYGTWCMRTLMTEGSASIAYQGCDGASSTKSLCEEWNFPTTCCKLPMSGQRLICTDSSMGFISAPKTSDFDNCESNCIYSQKTPTMKSVTRCGCENPGHRTFSECTQSRSCDCKGRVRLGYEGKWSAWKHVNGGIQCTNAAFGGDPWRGQAKECICEAEVTA